MTMSAMELEQAIRSLPRSEAAALLQRVEDLRAAAAIPTKLSDEVIAKWQVTGGIAGIKTSDEYLQLIRDGDRD